MFSMQTGKKIHHENLRLNLLRIKQSSRYVLTTYLVTLYQFLICKTWTVVKHKIVEGW